MKNTIHHSSWVVTLPLTAAAVAYILLFYLPGERAIGRLQEQIKAKQDYIVGADSVLTALRTAQQKHEKALAYSTAWRQNAPTQENLSSRYWKINELANTAGTTITRFDPQPPVEYNTIRQIPLALGCTGTFAQIYEFLRGVESLPIEIWISAVKLEKIEGPAGTIDCELTLVMFGDNSDNSDYVKHSD